MNQRLNFIGLLMLLAVSGCQSKAKPYDVTVTNRLAAPITVWLTEAQPPYEKGLASPEEVAMTMNLDAPLGGRIIEPGMTGRTKNEAHVGSDNRVVLRIYRADHMTALLAMSAANPDRMDIPLLPGETDIDVVWKLDHMTVEEHVAGTANATTQPSAMTPPSK